jgi:hypothetical protein
MPRWPGEPWYARRAGRRPEERQYGIEYHRSYDSDFRGPARRPGGGRWFWGYRFWHDELIAEARRLQQPRARRRRR